MANLGFQEVGAYLGLVENQARKGVPVFPGIVGSRGRMGMGNQAYPDPGALMG